MTKILVEKQELKSLVEELVNKALPTVKKRLQYSHAEAAEMLGLTE